MFSRSSASTLTSSSGARFSDIGEIAAGSGSKASLKWQAPFRDVTFETADHGKGKRVFLVSGLPVFDPETGKFECVRGTAEDITERRQAEAALRASEQRFRDFAESASDWFWTMGPDLRVTYVSDRYFRTHRCCPRRHYRQDAIRHWSGGRRQGGAGELAQASGNAEKALGVP